MRRDLLIIKTGSTFSPLRGRRGDFEDWITLDLDMNPGRVLVVNPCEGEELPDPAGFSGIVITGSHAMVTDRYEWSDRIAAWLPPAVRTGIPILGICYGHQLLAVAMGGQARDNPTGSVFGTVEVVLTDAATTDALLGGLPSPVRMHVTHTQSVSKLPPGATLLAEGSPDLCYAFSIGTSVWGLQFHPEFDADIVGAYIEKCRELLCGEGQDPEQLKSTVSDTPYGKEIMKRFAEIVGAGIVDGSVDGRNRSRDNSGD